MLKAYGDYAVPVKGSVQVLVWFKGQEYNLQLLFAVTHEGGDILGTDWFDILQFKVSCYDTVFFTKIASAKDKLITRIDEAGSHFPKVFSS